MTRPQTLSALHAGWCNLLDAAHAAGLASELSYAALARALGHAAMRAPDPTRFAAILTERYAGGSDPGETLARRRADGLVVVWAGEPMTATRFVARLIGAAPVLAGVTVEQRPFPALRRGPRMSRIAPAGGWVELADVVDAANALLDGRGPARFVPLVDDGAFEAYVLADVARASGLDEMGLMEPAWVDAFRAPLPRAA